MNLVATTAINKLNQALSSLPFSEANLGCCGLHVYLPEEIEEGQLGYPTSPDGSSLCTGETGAWRPEWIVIGYDTGLGDPLIMDTSDPALPVMTDMHGQGRWEPVKIAASLEIFLSAFKDLAQIAEGRGSPVELEAKPLSQRERSDFLRRISELNGNRTGLEFWSALLEG